jgi:uncharacterized protein YndB with AHSA1/START domain
MKSNSVHSYVTYIRTSREKLWQALTSAEFTENYFFGRSVESSWKVGAPVKYWQPDGTLDVSGRVLVCDPLRFVSFTWHVEWIEEFRKLPEAVVAFRLDQIKDQEIVRLTFEEHHPTMADPKYVERGRVGWPLIFSGLKTLLETGKPLPDCDWMG